MGEEERPGPWVWVGGNRVLKVQQVKEEELIIEIQIR